MTQTGALLTKKRGETQQSTCQYLIVQPTDLFRVDSLSINTFHEDLNLD